MVCRKDGNTYSVRTLTLIHDKYVVGLRYCWENRYYETCNYEKLQNESKKKITVSFDLHSNNVYRLFSFDSQFGCDILFKFMFYSLFVSI